jgi:UDPglucose 6-dehydrogenase
MVSTENQKPTIGFIGQGYVGKNYADDFERREYSVVRYAQEPEYNQNGEAISACDIVFVAVPTPTTPDGFDDSIVRDVIAYAGRNSTVVIKSTVLPGTTEEIQEQYPDRTILFSPEFLSEATAAHDAAHPIFNLIGIPGDAPSYRERAERVLATLPESQYSQVCMAREAELFKYIHNCEGYFKIVFLNLMYEIANGMGIEWGPVQEAIEADPMISNYRHRVAHKSGHGAGGHCFIKDFEALLQLYKRVVNDPDGEAAMERVRDKNVQMLRKSEKDLDLLEGVYGFESTPYSS